VDVLFVDSGAGRGCQKAVSTADYHEKTTPNSARSR